MASLKNHGNELYRYVSVNQRGVIAVCSDGRQLINRGNGWKAYTRVKPGVALDGWAQNKLEFKRKLMLEQPWRVNPCRNPPSYETMNRWDCDGIAYTPNGARVEPDGVGPDGAPSWLIIMGII